MLGDLKNKTRIMVTHSIDFLHLCDKILIFQDGKIILEGSYEELKNEKYLLKLIQISQQESRPPEVQENSGDLKNVDEEKKIIIDEDYEQVSVGFKTFKLYFKNYNGGNLFLIILNIGLVLNFFIQMFT